MRTTKTREQIQRDEAIAKRGLEELKALEQEFAEKLARVRVTYAAYRSRATDLGEYYTKYNEFSAAYENWDKKYKSLCRLINGNEGFFTFPSEDAFKALVSDKEISFESQYSIPLEEAEKGVTPPKHEITKESFLGQLAKQREKNLEQCLYKLDPIKVEKKKLEWRLTKYKNRIEKYKGDNGVIDFAHGFFNICGLFADRRAENRKANYLLTLALIERLKQHADNPNITAADIVSDSNLSIRKQFIDAADDRGINSSELNKAIRKARHR